jgi:hypothetical protein
VSLVLLQEVFQKRTRFIDRLFQLRLFCSSAIKIARFANLLDLKRYIGNLESVPISYKNEA